MRDPCGQQGSGASKGSGLYVGPKEQDVESWAVIEDRGLPTSYL